MFEFLRRALIALALAAAGTASGQSFPDRPVRLVVAFVPGGASDTMARQILAELSQALGQPVIIENRPGGNGYVGWTHGASAPPDGHTLLFAENALAMSQALFKRPANTFDPLKEYDAIARSPALPGVPTLKEAGVAHADVDLRFWYGLFGPKGIPEPAKAKLDKAVATVMADPKVRERLAKLDITPEYAPGSMFSAKLASEIQNWSAFVDAKNIKPE